MTVFDFKKLLLTLMILSSSTTGIAAKRSKEKSIKQILMQIVTIGSLLHQPGYSQETIVLSAGEADQSQPSSLHLASEYDDAYRKRHSLKYEYGGDDALVSWDSRAWKDYNNWVSTGSYSGSGYYYKDLYIPDYDYMIDYSKIDVIFLQGAVLTNDEYECDESSYIALGKWCKNIYGSNADVWDHDFKISSFDTEIGKCWWKASGVCVVEKDHGSY